MVNILTASQKEAIKILESGANVFLTGGAGTGKTFLLQYLQQNAEKKIIITAPTGIAAIHAGGATLHHTFGIPVKVLDPLEKIDPSKISDAVKAAEIIIIDEISMCRIDVFQYVIRKILFAEKLGKVHKQIILIGDFYQLPPVVPNRKNKDADIHSEKDILAIKYGKDVIEGYAFMSPLWYFLDFKTVFLNEIVRQKNKEFSTALNQIREGNFNGLDWIEEAYNSSCSKDFDMKKAPVLCSSNAEAEKINKAQLGSIRSKNFRFEVKILGEKIKDSDYPASKILELKEGCRVISLVNDRGDQPEYSNGSLGTVIQIDDDYNEPQIEVKFDNGNIATIGYYKWDITRYVSYLDEKKKTIFKQEVIATVIQVPLKLAYAITIHRAQGQTYDKVSVDPKKCFSNGQLYVALSRVSSIEGLHLIGTLNAKQLRCSAKVKSFYNTQESFQKEILSSCKKEILSTLQKEISQLPYYSNQEKQAVRFLSSTPYKKTTQKKAKSEKKTDESFFATIPNNKQKLFLKMLSNLAAKNEVTKENYQELYNSLSQIKKDILLKIFR